MNYYIKYFEIAAFISSLIAWKIITKSKFLILYLPLLFVIVAGEFYGHYLLSQNLTGNNAWLYNIQVPLQYLFYLAILYYSIENLNYKKIIILFSCILILLTIISEIYFVRQGSFNSWSYSCGSVFVIVSILFKFYEMLRNPTEFNFTDNPFFYMLFAFLLFNVGTLPYFTMGNWLYFVKGDKNTVTMLANVMSILNYILYSTYTIAFLWMRKRGFC